MKFIVALLAVLLPTNTVDGIVSFLATLAEQRAAAEEAQNARAASLRSQAAAIVAEAEAAEAEGERAKRVRTKLADLVA